MSAQVYRLTHFYLTQNSLPKPYDGKLEIQESQLLFTAYVEKDGHLDSTVTIEKIIKNKGYYVKTMVNGGANNYEISLSSDKKEKAAGIYYISQLYAANSGARRTIFYKAVAVK